MYPPEDSCADSVCPLQQEHFHHESSTNISELLNETSPNTPVPNLDAFDYSELINAADEKVIESALSAFEYEQMSNGKYLIKKSTLPQYLVFYLLTRHKMYGIILLLSKKFGDTLLFRGYSLSKHYDTSILR